MIVSANVRKLCAAMIKNLQILLPGGLVLCILPGYSETTDYVQSLRTTTTMVFCWAILVMPSNHIC